jgi:ATP-dependent Zn protease
MIARGVAEPDFVERREVSMKLPETTAYHEAAHAVTSILANYGVTSVTITPNSVSRLVSLRCCRSDASMRRQISE